MTPSGQRAKQTAGQNRSLWDESAGSGVEYATLLGLIVTSVIVAGAFLGLGIRARFASVGTGNESGLRAEEPGAGDGRVHFVQPIESKAARSAWDFTGDFWRFQDGSLHGGLPGLDHGEHRALARHPSLSNGSVTVRAMLLWGEAFGIFFRTEGERPNGYSFEYAPGMQCGQFLLRKWVHGYPIRPPLAVVDTEDEHDWYGSVHTVEVVFHRDTFQASLNGRRILVGTDGTYTIGRTGLRIARGAQARFADFTVVPAGETKP